MCYTHLVFVMKRLIMTIVTHLHVVYYVFSTSAIVECEVEVMYEIE